jgi:F-type H+-transporting ATPase subunit delta
MAELTDSMGAFVVSATTLGESRILALEDVLSKKLGHRVTISASVDPSVIGGLYIRAGGRIIDRTVKRRLRDLKDSLMRRSAR